MTGSTGITAVSKAQIYIGAASYPTNVGASPLLTDFTGDTYTLIGSPTNIGSFGDSSEEIKVNTISDARTFKLKGQKDAGDLDLELAFIDADPGELALIAANAGDGNYSFKVVLNNAVTTGTGKGTTTYFRGLVTSCQTKLGAANTNVSLVAKIAINSAPLTVAAS